MVCPSCHSEGDQRKVAIILDVLKGKISVPEAARKHGFTHSEFRQWTEECHRAGVDALKIRAAGIDVTPGLGAIYERAAEAWGDRPIDFDLNFEHTSADGGMRIYRERVQIWLKRTAAYPVATLIHEVAHAVIARESRDLITKQLSL